MVVVVARVLLHFLTEVRHSWGTSQILKKKNPLYADIVGISSGVEAAVKNA